LKTRPVGYTSGPHKLWFAVFLLSVATVAPTALAETSPSPSPTPEPSESIEELVNTLMNGDSDRALLSALTLLDMSDSGQALSALRAALEGDKQEVRMRVMKAFEIRHDPRANDLLVAALSDQSEEIRAAAISALSEQETDTLIAPLSNVLLDQDAPQLAKEAAAKVLGAKRNKQAIQLLIRALEENPEAVKAQSAATLAALTSFDFGQDYRKWTDWWKTIEPLSREQLLEMILLHREQQLAEASSTLKAVKADAADIWISLLESRNDRTAVAPLAKAIQLEYAPVRKYAAGELGKIESEESAKVLADAINDESADVRVEIINSLGRIGEKGRIAVAAISECLITAPQRAVRRAAAAALNAIKDKAAASALIAALRNDEDPDVRANAAKALGNIAAAEPANTPGGIGAVSVLLDALYKDAEPSVRREAALALGKTRDRNTVRLLFNRRDDDDDLVRRAIAQSLGKLGGEEAVSALLELAEDSHPFVREEAFTALGDLGDPAATESLVKGLADSDQDAAAAAADALQKVLADNMSAYLDIAKQQMQSGNRQIAAKLYEVVLGRFATNTSDHQGLWDVKRRLANLLLEEGNCKKAYPLYEELSQHEPTLEVLGGLAACYDSAANHLAAAKTRLRITRLEGADSPSEWAKIVDNALALKSAGKTNELRQLLLFLEDKAPDLGTPETRGTLQALMQELTGPEPSPIPTPTPPAPPSSPTPTPTPSPTPTPYMNAH